MADGHVLIDTKVNPDGLEAGLNNLAAMAKGAIGGITQILMGATAALGALGVAAVKVGSEFEAQMSRVLAISGATEQEFVELNALAKQLGADTAFSASEAAEGMENLASAGFEANKIIAAMPGLLDLAAVSGGDVAVAAEIAASALNAFGLEAGQAGHVANVFAQAAALTNAEAYDMGEALKYVAPVAHAMGLELEETAAAIGLMSDAGIKGSQAGTALRGALSRIAKPTEIMCDTMDRLGISFYDSKGKMISLKEQIEVLQTAFEGLSQEERNQALVTLYGQESLSGMLALIEAGPEKIDELTESLENSEGAAAAMAATIQDNLKGDIEALMGSLETLGITFYEKVNAPLRDVVQLADGYIGQLQSAFDADGFSGLVSAIGDVLAQAVTEVANVGPELIEAGTSLIESFIEGLISSAPTVGNAAVEIGVALVEAILTISADLISLGAELLVALADGITNNSGKLVEAITQGFAGLAEAVPAVIEAAIVLIDSFVSAFMDNAGTILEAAVAIGEQLAQSFGELAPMLLSVGGELLFQLISGIIENLPALADGAMSIVESFVEGFATYVPLVLESGRELLTQLCTGITENLPELIDRALDVLLQFSTTILENTPTLIAAGFELLSSLVQGILEALPNLLSKGPEIISNFANVINNAFPQILKLGFDLLWQIITGLISAIPDLIANIPKILAAIVDVWMAFDWISLGRKAITLLKDGIIAMASAVKSAGKNILDTITKVIRELPGNLATIGKNAITGMGNAISGLKSLVSNAAKAIFNAIIDAVKGLPSQMLSIGKNLVQGIWNGISGASGWLIGKVRSFCSSVLNSIKSFFGIASPSKVFRDLIGKNLMIGLAEGISAEAQTAIDATEDAAEKITDVDFSPKDPKIPGGSGGIDYAALVTEAKGVVQSVKASTSEAVSGSSADSIYRSVSNKGEEKKTDTIGSNPKYIQNDIYIDGKQTARVLTPYVAEELDWEGK